MIRKNIQILVSRWSLFDSVHLTFPKALQWHYRILQALALDEDLPAETEDKTIPKYKQIDKVRTESPTPPPPDDPGVCWL